MKLQLHKKNVLVIFFLFAFYTNAQIVTSLSANGPGNTYEEINAVFAPNGGDVIEAPGITPNGCTNHDDYVNSEGNNRHIQEIFDTDLNTYVYQFSLHIDEDIDRDKCSSTDRQRNEIKTYAPSPDYLKGIVGETVVYQWKFKLPIGFQASSRFTHIHQLKSVGGITAEESIPMITLTIFQKGSGDRMELRYAPTDDQNTISGQNVLLSALEGNWMEVTETITYGFEGNGAYAIKMTNVATGAVLMDYSNNTNRWYKTNADFIRPKWGFYRNILEAATAPLKDEDVFFADFSITEFSETDSADNTLSNESFETLKNINIHPNPASDVIYFPFSNNEAKKYRIEITNSLGKPLYQQKLDTNTFLISYLKSGMYFLKIIDTASKNSTLKKFIKL